MDPNNKNLADNDQSLNAQGTDSPPHQPGDMFAPSSANFSEPNLTQPTIVNGSGQNPADKPRRKKWLLIAIVAILILAAVSTAAFLIGKSRTTTTGSQATSSTNPAYQNVIDKFISAMRSGDKQTADSLETSAFQTNTKADSDTTSYYDACQNSDALYPSYFAAAYINSAIKVTQDYTAQDGTKGKETVYTTVITSSDSSSSSDNILTIAAITVGGSYLIDFVNTAGSSTVNSNVSN